MPDSQNGFDNGGMCGVCKWHKNPAHVEFALTVLEQLTSRYRARLALWGIEVLNEPISEELWNAIDLPHRYPPRDPEYARGSEPVPTGFLKDFYTTAYRRIRAQSDDVTIVFHDGFRIREWDGFFTRPDFERIVLDTHLYTRAANRAWLIASWGSRYKLVKPSTNRLARLPGRAVLGRVFGSPGACSYQGDVPARS